MAETAKKKEKKGQVRFRFPATVPEAVFRTGRALVRRVGKEFKRPAKQGTQVATGRKPPVKDTGPRRRPAPSEAFKSRQLTREVEEMLGDTPRTTTAEATPPTQRPTAEKRAPKAETPALAAPIAKARSKRKEKRRERLRQQGFTETEVNEMEP